MRLPVALLALLMLGTDVSAHPHVFVDVRGSFVVDDDGTLQAVRIHWLYDAFTSLVVQDILELDEDGDGQLNQADLDKFTAGETDWPPDYDGDTYLYLDGQKTRLSRPLDAAAAVDGDRIGIGFTLALDTPVPMAGRTATLKLYDPLYYYSYSVTPESHVDGPAGECDFDIIPFTPDAQSARIQSRLAALSREEMPEDPNIGALFAETIELTCR